MVSWLPPLIADGTEKDGALGFVALIVVVVMLAPLTVTTGVKVAS